MIHRDTMLKFSALFDLAKYLQHTQNFHIFTLKTPKNPIFGHI